MAIIERLFVSVISSLYQYSIAALIITILSMLVYDYIKERGFKQVCRTFFTHAKGSKEWRKNFLLVLSVSLILFRTVLCRQIWGNPISDVLGGWSLKYSDGNLNTELIENIILFIPFSILCASKLITNNTLTKVFIKSIEFGFVFSLIIEILQIVFRVGTFQISDLIMNSIGSFIGGIVYIIGRLLCLFMRRRIDRN